MCALFTTTAAHLHRESTADEEPSRQDKPHNMDCVMVKQEASTVYDGLGLLDDSSAESFLGGQQYYVPSMYEPAALGNNGNDSDTSCSSGVDRHENPDDLFQYDEESDSGGDEDGGPGVHHPRNAANYKHLRWTKHLDKTVVVPFQAAAWNGLAEDAGGSGSPVDFFHRFFPEELYQVAQTETNNFAEYYREKRRDLGRAWWEWTDADWRPVDSGKEMAAFLGVCIAMGVHSLPEPRDYWSGRRGVGVTLVRRSGLSAGRFDRIMRYFYLSNPWRDPEMIANPERRAEACTRDPLYKVGRHLQEQVRSASVARWQPQKDLVLQELTRGQHRTNGWKLVALRDATSGYVSNFKWYHDQEAPQERNRDASQEAVVSSLVGTLSGKGHCVYSDGVYISPIAACQLSDVNIYVTTNQSSWPGEIARSGPNLEVGQSVTVQHGGVTATAWQGSGLRRCLSSVHDGQKRRVTVRVRDANSGERAIREVLCPTPVADLTAVLDRLPRHRLLLRQSPVLQRLTNSWWKRLVWLLLDVCVNNAYASWSAGQNPALSYSEFAMELASGLIFGGSLVESTAMMVVPEAQATLGYQNPPLDAPATLSGSYYSPPVSRQPVYPSLVNCSPPVKTAPVVQDSSTPGADASAGGERADEAAADARASAPEASPGATSQHCLVKFPGRGRNCRQCLADKKRTRCGRRKDTQFGCLACGLNLCRLGCFFKYHRSRGLKIRTVPLGKIKRINRRPPPLKRRKLTNGVKS